MIEVEIVHTANREFPYTVWRLRIPGGWLYYITGTSPVFVPEQAVAQQPFPDVVSSVNFTPLSNK